eukprot:2445364-Prymnesium_polylepis.1
MEPRRFYCRSCPFCAACTLFAKSPLRLQPRPLRPTNHWMPPPPSPNRTSLTSPCTPLPYLLLLSPPIDRRSHASGGAAAAARAFGSVGHLGQAHVPAALLEWR